MYNVVDIKDYEFVTFICKSSEGLNWFLNTGLNKLETRLNNTDLHYNIVFNLGVNDIHNSLDYANLYNSLKAKYPQHNFFVASLNPIDESKTKHHNYSVTTKDIEAFNNIIKENISEDINYIDSYNYLMSDGFETVDGLHYTNNSSTKILDYLSNTIKNMD